MARLLRVSTTSRCEGTEEFDPSLRDFPVYINSSIGAIEVIEKGEKVERLLKPPLGTKMPKFTFSKREDMPFLQLVTEHNVTFSSKKKRTKFSYVYLPCIYK